MHFAFLTIAAVGCFLRLYFARWRVSEISVKGGAYTAVPIRARTRMNGVAELKSAIILWHPSLSQHNS
jgi:hypothetical protein